MVESDAEDEVRDAGLIFTAQRVETSQKSLPWLARTYAELLGGERSCATKSDAE